MLDLPAPLGAETMYKVPVIAMLNSKRMYKGA
jgi:hypothetical protein